MLRRRSRQPPAGRMAQVWCMGTTAIHRLRLSDADARSRMHGAGTRCKPRECSQGADEVSIGVLISGPVAPRLPFPFHL